MARFSLKSTLFSVLLLIIFVLTISQFKNENPPHPKTNPDLQQKSGDEKSLPIVSESQYENPIEKMMKKNMVKADQNQLNALTPEEFKKLPKPEEILKIAKGPLQPSDFEAKQKIVENLKNQLNLFDCRMQEKFQDSTEILIGVPHSGLIQMGQILHQNYGDFVLSIVQENRQMTPNEVFYILQNLQKCVIISQENVLRDGDLKHSNLACNSHILNICDENCLKSPSLLSDLCAIFPSKTLILDQIKLDQLKSQVKSSKIRYLYRDPRAIIKEKLDQNRTKLDLNQEAEHLCQAIEKDLKIIEDTNIQKLRFEDFALKPHEDHLNQKSFQYCQIHLETLDFKALVDSWKFKFSMEEIMVIEDACNNVLNVLEYPIYGSNLIINGNSAE